MAVAWLAPNHFLNHSDSKVYGANMGPTWGQQDHELCHQGSAGLLIGPLETNVNEMCGIWADDYITSKSDVLSGRTCVNYIEIPPSSGSSPGILVIMKTTIIPSQTNTKCNVPGEFVCYHASHRHV